MADEGEDKQSKTEEPTEKKLRDAVEKGNIPQSRELSHVATFVAILLAGAFFVADGAVRLTDIFINIMSGAGTISLHNGDDFRTLGQSVGLEIARFLVAPIAMFMLLGFAAPAFQNVPRIVFDRIRPKASNVSIGKGLKKIFGAQGLVEFLKTLFKFTAVSAVVVFLMAAERHSLVNVIQIDPVALPEELLRLTMRLVAGVCIATILLVGIDLVWVRFHWRHNLRMSRKELKDEFKQTEGDPLVKSKMKSLGRDRARQRMMAAVPRATVVVTNPTHYSVALRYDRDEDAAPLVLAKGQNIIALKIREIAGEHDIPIVENKPVAQQLFKLVEVDQPIPPQFYRAVAEIIHYVYSRSSDAAAPFHA